MSKKKPKTIDGLSRKPTKKTVGFDEDIIKKRRNRRNMSVTNKTSAKSPQTSKHNHATETISAQKSVTEIAAETVLERPEPKELGDFSTPKKSLEDLAQEVGGVDIEMSSDDIAAEVKKKKKDKKLKNQKEKQKWSKKRKILTVFIILLLLVGAAVGAVLCWGNDIISKVTNGESGIWDVLNLQEDVKLKTDSKGRTNILAFGTSGYDMGGSDHDGAQLTDSIMVISLDQETKDVAMLSFPRDLLVSRTCTATGKINEIYWCYNQDGTDETGGAEALKAEIQDILGIEIQYYVHLNWGALIALVDSVGGITVTLDEDIADSWTNTYIDTGVPVTLNGEQALGLARARHGTVSGDFSRGNSQQKILIALKEKMAESGIGVAEAVNILNSLGDNVRMNLSLDEIKSAVKIVSEMDLSNIRQVPLVSADGTGENYMTTATFNEISYVIPMAGVGNYADLQSYIAKMFSSDSSIRENATIMVLNGTGIAGSAAEERAKLMADGYNVTIIDDAPEGAYTSTYYVYQINDGMSGTASALGKRYGVTVKDASQLPEGIYADGVDFVVVLGQG